MILINMEKPSLISKDSLVPVGLVMTLLGAAVSFGVMYQRINDVDTRLTRMEEKLDRLSERSLANQ